MQVAEEQERHFTCELMGAVVVSTFELSYQADACLADLCWRASSGTRLRLGWSSG
jgi:hypothetical protein